MKFVRTRSHGPIAEILLFNPPVNALGLEMLDELCAALEAANADDGVRAIVLSSDIPGRFCAGLDLKALANSTVQEKRELLTRLYIRLYDTQFNLRKPSICAVAGAVRGGGMTVAISSDLIVSSTTATFGYPEIDVGVLPAIHFAHLPRIVGRHRAFDLLFTGRIFNADEAQAYGLVARAAPAASLMEEAMMLARTLAAKPPGVLSMGRRAFCYATDNDYRRSIATAVEVFCNAAASDEAKEGLGAFVEKRRPRWAGL